MALGPPPDIRTTPPLERSCPNNAHVQIPRGVVSAAFGQRGGHSQRNPPSPPRDDPLHERAQGTGAITSPPAFFPPTREGTIAAPAPRPRPAPRRRTGTGRGRHGRNGSATASGSGAPTTGGGGGSIGGQPVGGSAQGRGGRGGQGEPSQPPPPSHGRGQAAGSSWVAGTLHPQQAQEGTRGRRGGYGRQSAHARTSPHRGSTRPLRFGLHQDGSSDITQGWETGGNASPPERWRAPWARGTEGPAARKPEPLVRVLLSCRVH